MKKNCQICGRDSTKTEIISSVIVRPAVSNIIKSSFPNWNPKGYICREDLQKYRKEYLHQLLIDEKGELSVLEKDVIDKLSEYESISENIEKDFIAKLTFGEKLSDIIASFGGSFRICSRFSRSFSKRFRAFLSALSSAIDIYRIFESDFSFFIRDTDLHRLYG